MPVLPEGILGSLLSTGGLGLLIFFLWRQVQELKADRRTESARVAALALAQEKTRCALEADWKATLNKLERQHVITLQKLAETKDAQINVLREALLDETRRRLEDKADYEKQFTHTAERIERLLVKWSTADNEQ